MILKEKPNETDVVATDEPVVSNEETVESVEQPVKKSKKK